MGLKDQTSELDSHSRMMTTEKAQHKRNFKNLVWLKTKSDYALFKFHKRHEAAKELSGNVVCDPRKLVKSCSFGGIKNRMLHES